MTAFALASFLGTAVKRRQGALVNGVRRVERSRRWCSANASTDLRREYVRLCDEVRRHDELYYGQEPTPEVSDAEYDALVRRLAELEERHPGLARDVTSPLKGVGSGKLAGRFEVVEHSAPMLSLANTYDRAELQSFFDRVTKELGGTVDYFAELKIDGVAMSLVYDLRSGLLLRAVTRGDGYFGEDVTQNMRNVSGVVEKLEPGLMLNSLVEDATFEVRGEIFMELAAFEALNESRRSDGLPVLANPRNAAAGAIKLLDPGEAARRPLSFIPYDVWTSSDHLPETHAGVLEWLRQLQFPTMPLCTSPAASQNEVFAFLDKVGSQRYELPFEVDGIVVKVDSNMHRTALGTTARFPKGALAFKFPPSAAETTLVDISVQVSRSGLLTPVADFDPIEIGGVNVARATLHNFVEVRRLGVALGDQIVVERGGDVIPKVVGRAFKRSNRTEFEPPSKCPACPACGRPVEWDTQDEAHLRCTNSDGCPAQSLGRIVHFASKGGMDIKGLGKATARKLLELKLVRDPADLYGLTFDDLIKVPGFQAKSVEKLLRSISESRDSRPLWRILVGLGAPGLGVVNAQSVASSVGENPAWDAVIDTLGDAEKLKMIPGLAEKSALAIQTYFAGDKVRRELDQFRSAGVVGIRRPGRAPASNRMIDGTLKGQVIVFTGTLASLTRDEARTRVLGVGGIVRETVTKETTAVVIGAQGRGVSKINKAKALGTRLLTEDEFLQIVAA